MRAEVFRLDGQVEAKDRAILDLVSENERLSEKYYELVERNEERLDRVSAHSQEILDSRLGINQGESAKLKEGIRPLGNRKPWGGVASAFEKKQRIEAAKTAAERSEHWKKRINEIEKQDKQEQK